MHARNRTVVDTRTRELLLHSKVAPQPTQWAGANKTKLQPSSLAAAIFSTSVSKGRNQDGITPCTRQAEVSTGTLMINTARGLKLQCPRQRRFFLCAVGVYRPNIMQQTVASCTCSQVQTERHETTSRDDSKPTLQINQRPQFGSQEAVQAEVRCVVAIAVVATGTHDGGGGGGRGRGIQHADVPII